MKDSSTKGRSRLYRTKGSSPRSIIQCIAWDFQEQPIYGKLSSKNLGSHFPEKVGHQFGRWTLITNQVFRCKLGYRHMKVRCECGTVCFRSCSTLYKGQSKGCDPCAHEDNRICFAPKWLIKRMESAYQRCNNPRCRQYPDYGGRGIEFNFESVSEAANWVMNNLGLKRHLEIDRENNNGHYEPGNLRYATRRTQVLNCRIKKMDFVYLPEEWPYSWQVVRRYLLRGMNRERILDQARLAVKEKRKRWRVIQKRLAQCEHLTY